MSHLYYPVELVPQVLPDCPVTDIERLTNGAYVYHGLNDYGRERLVVHVPTKRAYWVSGAAMDLCPDDVLDGLDWRVTQEAT